MPRKELYREYDEEGRLVKKECGKCGKILNFHNFHRNYKSKDGYSNMCGQCKRNYNAEPKTWHNKNNMKGR